MVGTITDEWDWINALDQRETSVYYHCDGIANKVGEITLDSTIYKNASEQKTDRSIFAQAQRAWMFPAIDNDFPETDPDVPGGHAFNWRTKNFAQNWSRSDLTPINHIDHEPTIDKETSINVTLELQSPPGLSVSVDVPYIKQDVDFGASDETTRTHYYYPENPWGNEARRKDCNVEQIASYWTEPASDGDHIAPSYVYHEFAHTDCDDLQSRTYSGDSLFGFLEYKSANDDT